MPRAVSDSASLLGFRPFVVGAFAVRDDPLHQAGLATLTHTPSPMSFLVRVLQRPENERAFLLLPVGYPALDCTVPDIERKPIELLRVRV